MNNRPTKQGNVGKETDAINGWSQILPRSIVLFHDLFSLQVVGNGEDVLDFFIF